MFARGLWCLLIGLPLGYVSAQKSDSSGLVKLAGVDSLYIMKFAKPNIIRMFYGTQATGLQYGSVHEGSANNGSVYSNVNDFVGFGLSYKIIDADVSFSLPATRFVNQDLQNLNQFKLALGFTSRKYVVRAFVTDSKGMVASDPEGKFQSTPDIHQYRYGGQFTYIFNNRRYSYRASVFQNEIQRRSAGSFMLRFEPFYRGLGVGTTLVPASLDNVSTYGDLAGLQYLKGPGLLVMPGYGAMVILGKSKFFFAPMIFAGPGVAFNFYKGKHGEFDKTTWEFSSTMALNAGYNGTGFFANASLNGDANYAPVSPCYFLTTNLRLSITVGYRFAHLEKFIPVKVF
jgi:hypothetical protein